jgi:GTP-binding protein Era
MMNEIEQQNKLLATGETAQPCEVKSTSQKLVSISIIGKPNAGKSSLLNQMIGQKISIVTPKVQTTRSIITGIVTIKDTQVIIFDTPGIFEASKGLERAMVRCAWSSLHNANIVMMIIDSTRDFDKQNIDILIKLKDLKINPVFLLNKIDLNSKYSLTINNHIETYFKDAKIFQISALSGKNVDNLIEYVCSKAKKAPWLYEEDDMTNLPMRFLAAEITREQLFLNLHEELPYNLTVQTESWQENANKSVKVNQVIIVTRENYKAIILGKNGSKIKEIGTKARFDMEKFFGVKIHLFLFIKIRDWEKSPEFYHYMGLKYEKDIKQ